jgi:hypothetical protein
MNENRIAVPRTVLVTRERIDYDRRAAICMVRGPPTVEVFGGHPGGLTGGRRSAVMSETMRFLAAWVAAFLTIGGGASRLQISPGLSPRHGLYEANPNHLWNRIHETFHVRVAPDGSEYGFDTVDPLLWRQTRHLLTGPSHARAVIVLDEFLASNAERLIGDPLKRAIFQHDLWAIFDWLASTSEGDKKARAALEQRLARVIRRVALTRKDIEALPDSYTMAAASGAFADRTDRPQDQPILPRNLFTPAGPWISVGGVEPLLPKHAGELGRSAFIVLWSLPGGSAATTDYLKKLWDFPQPFVSDDAFRFAKDGEVRARLNPALPPVPDGTRIALVRKMLLIDDAGVIIPSNLIQSIQVRAFPARQAFSELKMSRAGLFAGKSGGLRAVGAGERDFITFSAKGMDPLEGESWRAPVHLSRVLDGCTNCHHVEFEPAIETVLSLRRILRPGSLVDSRHDRWARWFTQPIAAAGAKSRSYEWGVLEALWQSQPQ